MNSNITDALTGWGIGYAYQRQKMKEDEVKQGKNYYFALLCVVKETIWTCSAVEKIFSSIPASSLKTSGQFICKIAPIASFFTYRLCARVKHNQGNEALNHRTIKILRFFAEHSGDMLNVTIVAASVALTVMGQYYLGGATLSVLAYDFIRRMGWVPHKVNLFVETYLPTVALVGSLIGGTALTRILTCAELSLYVSPATNLMIHTKVDAIIHRIFKPRGPTISEIDKPVVENKNLNFDQIMAILDQDGGDYTINSSHCSKWAIDLSKLSDNRNFDVYLELFNKVDWTAHYPYIKASLKTDDRFLDFLQEQFPNVNIAEAMKGNLTNDPDVLMFLREQYPYAQTLTRETINSYMENLAVQKGIKFQQCVNDYVMDNYIGKLAQSKGITKEQYLAGYLKEQMEGLVGVLTGRIPVQGSQKDLEEAMHNCGKILPYLLSLNLEKDKVEFEDALLKLAIEGGKYCARGIKRVSNDLIYNVIQKTYSSSLDPIQEYEGKLKQALQAKRNQILQNAYFNNEFWKIFSLLTRASKETTDRVLADDHTFELYRINLSLGFYPLTDRERRGLDLIDFIIWQCLFGTRQNMYKDYLNSLDEAVKEIGEVNFGIYMQQIINQDPHLSEDQKEQILDKFTSNNDGLWSPQITQKRFHRLMFVMLGILRAKS